MRHFSLTILFLSLTLSLVGCTIGTSLPSPDETGFIETPRIILKGPASHDKLKVEFAAKSGWNERVVPGTALCHREQGISGATPTLHVTNIPAGANALIVEFNVENRHNLSYDGALGKVGFYHQGSEEAWLLPVKGETKTLPDYAFSAALHRVESIEATPYFPPCRILGVDLDYFALIYAVQIDDFEAPENRRILASGRIRLGKH